MDYTFFICKKCSGNAKKIKKKLRALDPEARIHVGCQSMCKIGRKKEFVIVNKKEITAKKRKKVIQKVEKYLASKKRKKVG
jgi:uncharacterized protein YuzB (UPF0349 family)